MCLKIKQLYPVSSYNGHHKFQVQKMQSSFKTQVKEIPNGFITPELRNQILAIKLQSR